MSSLVVSAIPATNNNAELGSCIFAPSAWGDFFIRLPHSSNDTAIQQEHELLKEQVRRMITDTSDEPSQKLRLIDAVQRLGVSYHFTIEIEDELQKLAKDDSVDEDDLYILALKFRLLRQQGIHIACDIFEKFRDCRGNFKESLTADVQGLLCLYEAAYLSVRGETILDDAIAFTTKNLESALTRVSPHEAEEIRHALKRPIRKCLPRLDARHYITIYSRDESHSRALLKFSKLDFTILQRLHQKELYDLALWWKSLDTATKLPFSRDRIVECYFWILGVYFEPQYSSARNILVKIIALATISDDTFDNFGTYEELKLLTEAIERWDESAIHIVPDRMKLIYNIFLNTYKGIEEEFAELITPYGMHHAKEEMKKAVGYYLAEAKCRDEGYIPTIEEYMDMAGPSTGYQMLATTSFLGMGALATEEAFEWVTNGPLIVKALTVIGRLMDDIVSHEFEQKRDHIHSAVECYMRQHVGVSEEEVVKLFQKEIDDAWKDTNQECLRPTAVAMPLLERVLNFSRAMDVMYKDEDGYTNPHVLKDYIVSLLVDPIDAPLA